MPAPLNYVPSKIGPLPDQEIARQMKAIADLSNQMYAAQPGFSLSGSPQGSAYFDKMLGAWPTTLANLQSPLYGGVGPSPAHQEGVSAYLADLASGKAPTMSASNPYYKGGTPAQSQSDPVARALGTSVPLSGANYLRGPAKWNPPTDSGRTGYTSTRGMDTGVGGPTGTAPSYFNAYGQPYQEGQMASYWQDPNTGSWYQGSPNGQVQGVSQPPWLIPQTTNAPATNAPYGLPSNVSYAQTPNPFINPGGGLDYGAMSGLFNNFLQTIMPQWQQTMGQSGGFGNWLGQLLSQSYPQNLPGDINSALTNNQGMSAQLQNSGFASLMPFLQTMGGNLNYLNRYGLPGNQQLQSEQQNLGGMASNLLGGPGNYGLTNLLQQIMQQGLPNQGETQGLARYQLGLSQNMQDWTNNLMAGLKSGQYPQSGAQGDIQNTLMSLIKGGGLSPEYVNSMRSLVLDPSRQALTGNLNQMAGGAAELTSPAFQELLRRQEKDFNDQLISQGFNNLQGFIGQGMQSTGQGFNQGMSLADLGQRSAQQLAGQGYQGFGAVPSEVSRFTGQAGALSSDMLNQALQRFSQGGELGLQNLSTIQQLAMQPYQLGQQGTFGGVDRQNQLLNEFLGSLLSYTGGQQRFGIDQGNQMGDLLRIFAALYGQEQENLNAAGQAKAGAAGRATSGFLDALIGSLSNPKVGGTPPVAG